MRDLRERPALRKRDQPRQQCAAASLEPKPAPRSRAGEWRAQADARLHQLHSLGSRKEGSLIRRSDRFDKVVTW
jgi:hypothetical protein